MPVPAIVAGAAAIAGRLAAKKVAQEAAKKATKKAAEKIAKNSVKPITAGSKPRTKTASELAELNKNVKKGKAYSSGTLKKSGKK